MVVIMTEKFCLSLFDDSGNYFLHACPLLGDQLSSTEMNIIDSLFGSPPEVGNNEESWFEVKKKKNTIEDHYEIIDGRDNPLAVIYSEKENLEYLSKDKEALLLDVFGGADIRSSRWDMHPIDE